MIRRGRYLAACLAAAVAAASGDPLCAGWPVNAPSTPAEDDWKPQIVPGPSGRSTKPFESLDKPLPEADGRPAPPTAGFPAPGGLPNDTNRFGSPNAVGANLIPCPANGCVVIFGDVERPGSYELSGQSISIIDLIARCGIDPKSEGSLHLVRDGRHFGHINNERQELLPGDVVVAQASSSRQPAASRSDVQIALVNLLDQPIALRIPASHATVDRVLSSVVNQKHLTPRDVTVLVGGTREVTGDHVVALTSGSVLIFQPQTVNAAVIPELQTNFYPAPPPSPAEHVASAPVLMAPSAVPDLTAPETIPAAPSETIDQPNEIESYAGPPTLIPPPLSSSAMQELSALPKVDLLAPPADEEPIRYPRTADASGAVPIGPIDADPHIVPIPTDSFYPGPAAAAEPPAIAQPAIALEDLPADEAVESDTAFEDLLPTILIGFMLGALTYVILRSIRNGWISKETFARLAQIGHKSRKTTNESRAASPDEMLAALVANRLAFREEPLTLPTALRVDGRSPALRRLRIDEAEAAASRPHFAGAPIQAATSADSQITAERSEPSRESQQGSQINSGFRIDPPQPVVGPSPGRMTGTPFERALAALQAAEKRN